MSHGVLLLGLSPFFSRQASVHSTDSVLCYRSHVRVRERAEDGAGESDGVRLGLCPAQPRTTMEPTDRGHRPLAFDKVSLVTIKDV